MDIEALLGQLDEDMKRTGRGGFRPDEIVGLVREAANKVLKGQGINHMPTREPVFTNAIADESPQRGVRGTKRGT
jgi:hypothetical protein